MNAKAILAITAAALCLTSCSLGPKYAKPSVPVAPAYSEQPPASFQEAAGWQSAKPSDSALRGNWWEMFQDEQLNALEAQVPKANQTLRISAANFSQARSQVLSARSGLFPNIGVGPNISTNRVSGNNPTGANGLQYGLFSLPVSASWDADFWGRIRKTIASAREQYQASAADLENVKLQLQTELAVDYFETHIIDAQKQLLDENVSAYQKALQLTTNRFEGGVAAKAEVEQARTQLDQTQAQNIDLGASRAQYEHAIAVLVGRNPEGFRLPFLALKRTPPPIPLGVPSLLLQRRPDIAAAERQVAAANEQIGIAKAAFWPDLVITATGGLQAGSIIDWFAWPSRFWSVGPQLAQNIFDAGQRRAQLQIAQAGYESTVANYRQTALVAFQEVEDNLATLRVLEQESGTQHEATVAAERSVELTISRYKGGLSTYLDVITAQTIALTNERSEVDLLRRRMDASVLLIKALGGGWDVSQLPKA